MKTTDKIISTLFLAVSDKRDNILKSIIENLLYSYDEALCVEDIFDLCKSEFILEPIYEEFIEALEALQANNSVIEKSNEFSLENQRKKEIFILENKLKNIEEKRFATFCKHNVSIGLIDEKENKKIWNKFNEYIYNCFLVDGKDAIYSFLPIKKDKDVVDRSTILKDLRDGLQDSKYNILVEIINSYPDRIGYEEVEYLNTLAEKAESFFALGLDEDTYKSAVNLNLQNLTVFADTNVLFSVLNIHNNPQNKAINELLETAQNSNLGFKFKYFPITNKELNGVKNDLQRVIRRTEFRPDHIKALIESGELDGFSRHYYEKKLSRPDAANPIYVIEDSRNIFLSRGVGLYNREFDFYEDKGFMEAKMKNYYEYESFINRIRIEKGFVTKTKRESQIEHDVKLRESILYLRDRNNTEEELRYLGITLDNQLLKFDKYLATKKIRRSSNVIQPSFISPSNFLRRVRAFLPVKTIDYKKAFISAMTNLTIPTGTKEQSIAIQRSMSYFQQIGIQDERAILNIVKNEILYKKLNRISNEEKRSIFIQSEVDKYLQELKTQTDFEINQKDQELKKLQDTVTHLEKAHEELSSDNTYKKETLNSTNQKIDSLNQKIDQLEKQQKITHHNSMKNNYLKDSWRKDLDTYAKGRNKLILTFFLTILPVLGTLIVNKNELYINNYLNYSKGAFILMILLGVWAAIAFIHRLIVDKDLMKNSWAFYKLKISKRKFFLFKEKRMKYHTEIFERDNNTHNKR